MKTKICIPITAKTLKLAKAMIRKAEKYADIIELRIDLLQNRNSSIIGKLLSYSKKEAMVTLSHLRTDKIEEYIKQSLSSGCHYIDLDYKTPIKLIHYAIKNKGKTMVIISYHNYTKIPTNLHRIYDKISSHNPDYVKIVAKANSINDNFKLFKLLDGKKNLIAFCMGTYGEISRILGPKYGSPFVYASLSNKSKSAPGQINIDEMLNYHIRSINDKTLILGIIGEKAEESLSKYIYNASFNEMGLNYVYLPFKVDKSELKKFMKNFRKFKFHGASITLPYKERIIGYLDKIDPTAKNIGAINTIIIKKDTIIGYNTDYFGAIKAFEEKTKLKNKKVLILGAGGASRAIIHGLKQQKSKITVINRTLNKAKSLAKEFNIQYEDIKSISKMVNNCDILINATSVGMSHNANQFLISQDSLKSKLVMDIIYTPRLTKLIKSAIKAKCEVITGDKMLLYQAYKQYKILTGKNPHIKMMESALNQHLRR